MNTTATIALILLALLAGCSSPSSSTVATPGFSVPPCDVHAYHHDGWLVHSQGEADATARSARAQHWQNVTTQHFEELAAWKVSAECPVGAA